jgi:hypothetical protein
MFKIFFKICVCVHNFDFHLLGQFTTALQNCIHYKKKCTVILQVFSQFNTASVTILLCGIPEVQQKDDFFSKASPFAH